MWQFPRDQCPLGNGGPNGKGGPRFPFVVPALTGSADLQPHGALSGASGWLFTTVVQLIVGPFLRAERPSGNGNRLHCLHVQVVS